MSSFILAAYECGCSWAGRGEVLERCDWHNRPRGNVIDFKDADPERVDIGLGWMRSASESNWACPDCCVQPCKCEML